MFKDLIIYTLGNALATTLDQAEEALQRTPFTECGATQEKSIGWVPPRGEQNGALVEAVNGHWIVRLMRQTKTVPGSVLAAAVNEKAARIEQEAGRKPGRKESKELKEEARLDLLPMAFAKSAATLAWIDRKAGRLVVATSSQARADELTSLLVEALPGLSLSLLDTQTHPQAAMAHWLTEQEPPEGFSIDRECELKSVDESKAVVRYARHPLDIAEVQAHIAAGKLPTRLALTWDDRVSFVLTEQLQLRKLSFLDVVFESGAKDEGGFDTDVAIATGELSKLIPELIEALGGEGREGALK
ncbi:recombination-associated protein RdgC [Paracidovorax wautersii]|uniref:recombination-associated protein RdgC n=1 Tax=Paracidovorax wautersii TaxID=1177982 RepID=UPI0031D05F20